MARPTLGDAFTRAIEAGRNLGPRGMPVTMERISHVTEDGRVEVLGVRIPVIGAGLRGLRAGDEVAVSWQAGKPPAAIRHSARRSTPVTPSPRLGTAVEELFIATNTTSGLVEVWFRNDQQVTNLELRVHMDADPVYVKWATRSDGFVVATAAHHYYICTLSRTADQILRAPQPSATVVRDEQPLDQNIPLVQAQNTFTLSGEEKYWTMTWNGINGSAGSLNEAAPQPVRGLYESSRRNFLPPHPR